MVDEKLKKIGLFDLDIITSMTRYISFIQLFCLKVAHLYSSAVNYMFKVNNRNTRARCDIVQS